MKNKKQSKESDNWDLTERTIIKLIALVSTLIGALASISRFFDWTAIKNFLVEKGPTGAFILELIISLLAFILIFKVTLTSLFKKDK